MARKKKAKNTHELASQLSPQQQRLANRFAETVIGGSHAIPEPIRSQLLNHVANRLKMAAFTGPLPTKLATPTAAAPAESPETQPPEHQTS